MAIEAQCPLATCVHVILDGSRALVYDARQADEEMCTVQGMLKHDPIVNLRWTTFLAHYGPDLGGIEFSTSGPVPPPHMPLGHMVQLCPFSCDRSGENELVRSVTPLVDSTLLGGPCFVAQAKGGQIRSISSRRKQLGWSGRSSRHDRVGQ